MKSSIFAVYKPKNWSSYDVIRYLKNEYLGEKIGHGGTLDPLAEGVLVIGVGREATKSLYNVLLGASKKYLATIELGTVSETDDSEGPLHKTTNNIIPTEDIIRKTIETFKGDILQTPPSFSAIKIKGRKAYAMARKHINPHIKPRQVTIHKIILLNYSYPFIAIETEVSSGTYIRALARDIGEKLKTGAYLKNLIRTQVGDFSIDSCKRITE